MSTKYVITERQRFGGRYVAIRGLSFATKAEAEAHVAAKLSYKRERLFVESRKVKDLDASQAMHCQCCNREIHAALGRIAHHGYTRPGHGWQTQSCFGAKRLPWEVDRSAVMDLINHLKEWLLRAEYLRCAVADEIEPVTHTYEIYLRDRGRYEKRDLIITRDRFADIVKANVDDVFTHQFEPTFDQFKQRDLDKRDSRITSLKRDIKEFTARYEGWTQTHKWEGKRWVAL